MGRKIIYNIWCRGCHTELAADEAVWDHGTYSNRCTYCESCETKHWPFDPEDKPRDPFDPARWRVAPCEYCKRPVYRSCSDDRAHVFCSDDCRDRSSAIRRYYNRRRHLVWHWPRPCPVCGEFFTPKRSDAKVCSTRCRMRSHRAKEIPPNLAELKPAV